MSTTPQFDPVAVAQAESGPADTDGPVSSQPCFPAWLLAALLGIVTLALYWPAIHHEFINYDDTLYVTENVHVRTGLTLPNIIWAFLNPVTGNWHPLTMLSHMLDCQLFGLNPWGHHLTSVLLHVLNTVLVFLLLRRLTGAVWRSALVAALFGWHPLNVESVAWVAERKNVLSLSFGLLTLFFYTRYAQSLAAANRNNKDRRAYGLALFCFALGLMCKSILVTWPCVFFLLDYWPLGRFQSGRWWPVVREKIPFFALVVAVSVVTVLMHRQEGDLMAVGSLPLGARVENALISYCRYLGKLFWPVNLAAFYPHPGYWPMAQVLLAVVFLAVVTLLLFVDRRRHPFLLMGWLWFLGTLVPVIGLMQVGGQAMADRHAYIPELGVFIIMVWGAYEFARCQHTVLVVLSATGFAALVSCLAVTRHQLSYWQNSETLFRHALAVTKNNSNVRYSLGCALNDAGKIDEAISQYQEALRINADDPDVHSNLGVALIQKNHIDEAIQQYQEALRLRPDDARTHDNLALALEIKGDTDAAFKQFQEAIHLEPDYVPAHYDFGIALNKQGQIDAAISQFQAAIQFASDNAWARYNLGNALAEKGQTSAAIAQFQEAIHLQPGYADAHNNLGSLLLKTGQIDAAIGEFQAAVRFESTNADAHYNLANALLKTGQVDETISEFKEAIRLKPDYAPAHYNLGVALNKNGQTDAAIGQFEEAIRRQPDYAIAHNSLGVALATQGRIDEAIKQFQAALSIKPDYASARSNLARAQALKSK